MSFYDHYKHLLGRSYVDGHHDCYGLVRDFMQEIYGVTLTNFARPNCFWEDPDLDIISKFMTEDGWEPIGVHPRALRQGDGLVFAVRGGRANHVGVYTGNGQFMHHLYMRRSVEENFSGAWASRLLQIVRHPEVTKARDMFSTRFELPYANQSSAPIPTQWP